MIVSKIRYESAALDKYSAQLQALSPFNVLQRGYSIVTRNGRAVYSADDLQKGDRIEIRFKDSSCSAVID